MNKPNQNTTDEMLSIANYLSVKDTLDKMDLNLEMRYNHFVVSNRDNVKQHSGFTSLADLKLFIEGYVFCHQLEKRRAAEEAAANKKEQESEDDIDVIFDLVKPKRMAEIYKGIPVLGSLPGSASEKAGLIIGDIIIEVNNEPTPNLDAYVKAKEKVTGRMNIKYVRDGVEYNTDMSW